MTIQTALGPCVAAAEMSVFWGRTEYHAAAHCPGTICSSGRVQMMETGTVAVSSRADRGGWGLADRARDSGGTEVRSELPRFRGEDAKRLSRERSLGTGVRHSKAHRGSRYTMVEVILARDAVPN
jgi:hypothetical protein